MADHQRRIHPEDLEAGRRPSAPLMPGGSFRSDKGNPPPAPRADHHHHQHPRGAPLPPPPHRVAPRAPLPPPPKRRSRGAGNCCCRLLCCLLCATLLLAVLAGAAALALYLAFDPKAPRYTVDRLAVSAFQVDPSLTARARFDVTVTAANPNARIGVHYEPGSDLGVWYGAARLARGALPAFYQRPRNTTVLNLVVGGQVQLGTSVVAALQDAQRTGAVPLLFRADVPVRVQLGGLKVWKVTSRVTCDLVVDRLMDVSRPIKIKTSNCKFSIKL